MTCKKIHKLIRFDVNILHLYIFSVGLHEVVKLSVTDVYLYAFYFFLLYHAVYIPDSDVNGIYLAASVKFYIT